MIPNVDVSSSGSLLGANLPRRTEYIIMTSNKSYTKKILVLITASIISMKGVNNLWGTI